MKGKLTIVLLSLVLVFGMIAASCDNGSYPADPYKNETGNDTHATPTDFPAKQKDFYDAATGMDLDELIVGTPSATVAGGVITFTPDSYDKLTIKLPAGIDGDFVIKYAAKKIDGPAKLTVIGGGNDIAYVDLETSKVGKLELSSGDFPGGKVTLQNNSWQNPTGTFKLKIISIQ